MKKHISFVVYGKPVALQRHRSGRNHRGGIIHYDPSKNSKYGFIAQAISHKPETPFNCPLNMSLNFYFKRPKSHYGTGKNKGIKKKTAPLFVTTKPDLDNLVKFVLDAMNEIFFKDDSQVCSMTANKFYCENPRTEISIFNILEHRK